MNSNDEENIESLEHSNYAPVTDKNSSIQRLSGMYQNWFLDYASYVILDRAVPHLADGLKPVQRRILYSMKRMDLQQSRQHCGPHDAVPPSRRRLHLWRTCTNGPEGFAH